MFELDVQIKQEKQRRNTTTLSATEYEQRNLHLPIDYSI